MGEIAEMMLDGTMCGMCGVFLEDNEIGGFPMYCSEDCANDAGATIKSGVPEYDDKYRKGNK